ncbi:hypothetical protein ACSFA0_04160 [Variovorax sp. LT1P1]|uniref:hypothetical protein n=1 Tax=Variovorax sp. LT1P1 TaxID=3443730 RepID=UPI003F465648
MTTANLGACKSRVKGRAHDMGIRPAAVLGGAQGDAERRTDAAQMAQHAAQQHLSALRSEVQRLEGELSATASNADVRLTVEVAVARTPVATTTGAPVLDSSTILEAPPWGFLYVWKDYRGDRPLRPQALQEPNLAWESAPAVHIAGILHGTALAELSPDGSHPHLG